MADQQNPNQQSQVLGADKSAKAGQSSTETRTAQPAGKMDGQKDSKSTSTSSKSSSNPTDVESDDDSSAV